MTICTGMKSLSCSTFKRFQPEGKHCNIASNSRLISRLLVGQRNVRTVKKLTTEVKTPHSGVYTARKPESLKVGKGPISLELFKRFPKPKLHLHLGILLFPFPLPFFRFLVDCQQMVHLDPQLLWNSPRNRFFAVYIYRCISSVRSLKQKIECCTGNYSSNCKCGRIRKLITVGDSANSLVEYLKPFDLVLSVLQKSCILHLLLCKVTLFQMQ